MTVTEMVEANVQQMMEFRPEITELEAAKIVAEHAMGDYINLRVRFDKIEKFVKNESREILHAFALDAPHLNEDK